MKYRTKLTLFLIGLTLFSNLLAVFILYEETKNLVFSQLQSKVLSIASTSAALIDGDKLAEIHEDFKNKDSQEVKDFQRQLKKVLKANQRKDTHVSLVYTFRRDLKQPHKIYVHIIAQTVPGRYPEDVLQKLAKPDELNYIGDLAVTKNYHHDSWGTWLIGYAPIRDSEGKIIATVGVNVRARHIQKNLDKVLIYAGWSLIISLAVAVGLSFLLSKWVSAPLYIIHDTVERIGRGDLSTHSTYTKKDEFGDLSKAINSMIDGLKERDRIKTSFARYVSRQILEKILETPEHTKLEGERRKVTVLFSDIRDFSSLAEKMEPEAVVNLLNEYFEKMISVIFKYQGTLDKIMGDGLMVLFGAPLDDPIQEEHAMQTAIEMQQELQSLCEKWKYEGKTPIHMGIGIHTGFAIVGNIGSEKRMDYTAIGDTVNIAFRIEQATKEFRVPIVISETTNDKIKEKFLSKPLGEFTIKGRIGKVSVYTLKNE